MRFSAGPFLNLAAVTLVLTVTLGAGAATSSGATDISDMLAKSLARWDDQNNRVVYYRNQITPSPSIAIAVTDIQGRVSESIDILKDFPGARTATVTDVAGGPGGTVIAACRVEYNVRPLKELILTYDSSGSLRNIIDTFPYEAAPVAVDYQGNIYIFAAKVDVDPSDTKSTYPTVIKYDSNGNLVASMLPSSNFPESKGAYPTDWNAQMGTPLLRVTPLGIAVFCPSSGYLVLLSPQGLLLARHFMGNLSPQIADQYKFVHGYTLRTFLDQNGELVLRMRLSNRPDKNQLQDTLVRVDSASLSAGILKLTELNPNVGQDGGHLVDIDTTGRGVYVYDRANSAPLVVKK